MIPRDTIKKTGSTFAHLALSMAALSGGANSYYQTKRQGGSYTPAKEMVARLNAKPLSAKAIQNSDWQKSLDPAVSQNTNGFELKKIQQARELIIVDGAVEDKSVIFRQAQPGVDIVEVPTGSDGMVELIKILSNYNNLDAVHIVSHAKAGAIQLGGQTIDQKELEEDVAGFAAINNAIREGGDLMLYGCDVAQGDEGNDFLEIIQNNTHVDVAASNDPTGNEAYGGNWELEIQKGDIEATPLPESIAMKDFTGTLQTQYAPSDFCSVNCAYSSPSHTSSDGHIFFDGSLDVYANNVYSEFYLDYSSPATYGFLQFSADGNNIASFELTQVNFATYAGTSCSSADVTGYLAGGGTISDSFTLSGSGSVNLNNLNGQQITKFRVNASGCTNKISYPLRVQSFEINNKQAPNSNNPPTDIALDATSINQSATGAGSVVGNLSTTDADGGDTHNYAFVSNGTSNYGSCGASGDDDNASFQMDNTNDDLEVGGSLTAGSYNVCVETDDGTDSYQESFEITVNDDVAPSFQNSTPAVSGTTNSQTTLTVRLDEIGTAYYVVVADGAGTPSSAHVKAGQDSGGSAALFSGSINISSASLDFTDDITGLSSGTAYDIYVVAEDDEGTPNLQSSPTKVDVTTDGPDADGTLTAAAGVTEPVGIASTLDTSGEAIDIFDFTLSDGGSGDGLPMTVSQIVVNVSGTSTDTERGQVTWRLNGPDVSNVTGSYNASADVITFSGLSISIADGGNETYTLNAYYNDNSGLTEDHTFILSVDGDTDVTTGDSGTGMGSTTAVTNGSGSTIDINATTLAFTTQPDGSVSGSALTTQPAVNARDAFGNTDVDFTETVTLSEASAGSLSGDVDIAAVSGVATFTDVAYTATADQESFTLTANDEDGTGTDLSTVDANSVTSDVVATKLSFTTEPAPTSLQDGVATSFTTVPVVEAMDANNIVDTGYNTDITLAEVNGAGSATMSGTGDTDGNGATVSITPSSGSSTFTGLQITYNNSGSSDETFNLRASSGGLTTANSTQLTAIFDTAPSGYTVSWDDAVINASEAPTATFTVSNAEVGATINYSISSSGDGNTATVSDTKSITSSTQQVTTDVSFLTDGTLTVEVSVTDDGGNTGDTETDNSATLDQTAPAGYSVSIDQDPINAANDETVSFTFAGAEVGTDYSYTFSSSGGGTNVTGSGTIATATDKIYGINVSGLGDGTITLAVVLTDQAGNAGSAATDTETKDTAVNSAPVLGNLEGDNVSLQPGEIKGIDNDNDATVTDADSPDFNAGFLEIVDKGGNNSVNGNFSVNGTNTTSGGDGTIAAGETIAIAGTSVGTIDATNDGQGGNTLTITFTSANATPARIQTLIRNLRWEGASGSGAQTFTLTLNDNDGIANGGDEDTEVDFAMTLGNPPMVSHLNGDEVDFIEGGSPVLLDTGTQATLSDADSPANYSGGNLLATVSSGVASTEDKLTLSTGGSVSLAGTTAGSNVSVNGNAIGTLDNNIAEGNDLHINFNTDATLPRVQELLRAIQYANSASPISEESREVTVTVTDNEGLTSSASTITINTLLRPEASDSRILVENNSSYTFKPSDFGLSDAGYSIKIESLPAKGTLKLEGSDVSANDEIPISSIDNGLLTWIDDSDEYGYGYSHFDFKVIDDGDLESAESYTLSIDVGIRTLQLTEGKGWRFLSSPSSDDAYASIFNGIDVDLPPAPYPSLYELDPSTYQWEAVGSMSTSPGRGEGFIFYGKLGEMPATLSFDGEWTALSESYSYDNLDYDGTGESSNPDNFYLAGNPHPIALDFCKFSLSHVSQAITFWDPQTGTGDYVSQSCDIEGGIEIAPFQSFWIRTTDVHPTASIPEAAYLGTSTDGHFKEKSSSDSDRPLITLNLTSEDNAFSNRLQVFFTEDAEDGLDPMDALKLSAEGLASEWLSFYSMDSKGTSYAIQALPYPESGVGENESLLQIPLNVETTENGFFTMDWTLGDLSALDAAIYLKDNSTGHVVDLTTQEQYSFMLRPTMSKGVDEERGNISGNQSSAGVEPGGQDQRFTLIVDYGAPDQQSVGIGLPEEFVLQQNYPNPFNPVTVIQFQLASQSNVELSVYDLTGRQVATLVDKPMQAGNHQVSFNGQDLSSGVYIYTLKAGAQMMSRKLTIVK